MVRRLLMCVSLVFVASAQNAQSITGTFGNQGQLVGGSNQPGFVDDSGFGFPGSGQPGTGQPGVVIFQDEDGDGVPDYLDICPKDSKIHTVNFRNFTSESLDEIRKGQKQAVFIVNNQGTGVTQDVNSKPGLMYGHDNIAGLDFDGKFRIDKNDRPRPDNDFVGFIFGYNSPKSFYVVMWKKRDQPAFECGDSKAERGLQLKRVNSIKGPSCELQDALWSSKSTPDEVTLLWDDFNGAGWEFGITYDWELIHRPNIGLIRFKVLEGTKVIADSGNIYDDEIKRGHIGVYCHSQAGITWSDLRYGCEADTVPEEIFKELPKDKQDKIRESLRRW